MFIYSDEYLFNKAIYYFTSISPIDGLFAFQKFYLSPVPWNVPVIFYEKLGLMQTLVCYGS